MSKESRTTKRAAGLLKDDVVHVAIPVTALPEDAPIPKPSNWFATLRGVPTWSSPDDLVIALTDRGTALLSANPSNPGIPRALLSRTESFPTLIEETEDGAHIDLDGVRYRVGLLHRKTILANLRDTAPTQDVERAEPEPVAPSNAQSETAPLDAVEEAPSAATDRESLNPRGAVRSGWAAALERGLLTPELPRGDVESRSRATMQCQRLLPDTYVRLSVPAKAIPRDGAKEPKGHFVIAFTDDGIVHFKAKSSNKALPTEFLGPVTSEGGASFEHAAAKERHGGVLTIGDTRFKIPILHSKSLVEHLERLEQ